MKETQAPSGYAIDDSTEYTVTVDNNAKCMTVDVRGRIEELHRYPADGHHRRGEVTGHWWHEVADHLRRRSDPDANNIGNSPSQNVEDAKVTANGVAPGTYHCTIVVDP